MTYPQELQEYYDAHDEMMDAERRELALTLGGVVHKTWVSPSWAIRYGTYKAIRYNAVKAGYLPEKPEFG